MNPRRWHFAVLFLLVAIACASAGLTQTPGKKAPPIDLQQLLQSPRSSRADWSSLKGKVVVLEFWATWCPSCVKNIPHLNSLTDQLKGKPVQFISITDENKKVVLPFLAKHPIHGWVGFNTTGTMFRSYGIEDRPTTIIVRPDGRIEARVRPWVPSLTARNLEKILAKKPSGIIDSTAYYSGDVRDENGAPLDGVSVWETNQLPDGWLQLGKVATDPNGLFRLNIDYPLYDLNQYPVRITFMKSGFREVWIEDLRHWSPAQLTNIQIVLRRMGSINP